MTAQIPPEFLAMFHMLEAAFPDWKPKVGADGVPGTVDVYWQALSEFEVGDIASAVGHAVNFGGFAPRIADLRAKAVAYQLDRLGEVAKRRNVAARLREDAMLALEAADPAKQALKAKAIADVRKFLKGEPAL